MEQFNLRSSLSSPPPSRSRVSDGLYYELFGRQKEDSDSYPGPSVHVVIVIILCFSIEMSDIICLWELNKSIRLFVVCFMEIDTHP